MQIAITSDWDDSCLEKRNAERHVGLMLIAKIKAMGMESICRIRNISATGAHRKGTPTVRRERNRARRRRTFKEKSGTHLDRVLTSYLESELALSP